MKTIPTKDSALVNLHEIEERISSIVNQQIKMDAIVKPRNMPAHHAKALKLANRLDALLTQRNMARVPH